MDNYAGHKRILIKKLGKINSIEQLQKALLFIQGKRAASYERLLRAALKKLWWDCHDNNKTNWADLEWEMKKYTTTKANKYTKPPLARPDIQSLKDSCNSYRQVLFITFLAETGVRVSEMTDILISDCITRGESIEISIIAKKTGIRLYKKISHKLFDDIRETCHGKIYLFETSGGKSVRPTYVSGEIRKIGKKINKKISAHSLRHFYATDRVNNGDDPTVVSRSLGHTNNGSLFNNYYTGQ